MKKLFIIFVNYNSGKQLATGVNSVLKSPSVAGIVIVDNASRDNSLSYLKDITSLKKVTLIKSKHNLGFYKALNIAIKKALYLGADAVMPLDFDLDFSFDFITQLSKVDGDIVAPALKSKWTDRWIYDYGGRLQFITGLSSHILLEKQVRGIGKVQTSLEHTHPYWIDFVSGGCTIIRSKVIKKIGFFDEDYFVYWGDADYAYTALENGFKVIMDGDTLVHHKLELASQTKNFRKLKISLFDNLTFIRKRVKWYFKPIAYFNILVLCFKILLRTFIN